MLRKWLPLALTWLLLASEAPTVTALVARAPDQETNLGAFGVALSLVLLVEALVLMLQAAATTLVRDDVSFRSMRAFGLAVSAITVPLCLGLGVPAVFEPLSAAVGLPAVSAGLARTTLLLLCIWPAAVGVRRLYQGVMIRQGETTGIVVAAAVRYAVMFAVALLLARVTSLPGAWIGAISLDAGVVAETVLTLFLAQPSVRRTRAVAGGVPLSPGECLRFYLPLAMTTFVVLAAQPIAMLSVGRGAFPVESYAVLPVAFSFMLLFRSLGISLQEIAVVWLDDPGLGRARVAGFSWRLAAFCLVLPYLVIFAGGADWWYGRVSALSPDLVKFAWELTLLFALLPITEVILSWQRALFLHLKVPQEILWGGIVELAGVAGGLAVCLAVTSWSGAVAAGVACILGRGACLALQGWRVRQRPSR